MIWKVLEQQGRGAELSSDLPLPTPCSRQLFPAPQARGLNSSSHSNRPHRTPRCPGLPSALWGCVRPVPLREHGYHTHLQMDTEAQRGEPGHSV